MTEPHYALALAFGATALLASILTIVGFKSDTVRGGWMMVISFPLAVWTAYAAGQAAGFWL